MYLEACNLIFENGILSHEMICSPESKVLLNIHEGMKWFINWKEELQKEPGNITLLVLSLGPLMVTRLVMHKHCTHALKSYNIV